MLDGRLVIFLQFNVGVELLGLAIYIVPVFQLSYRSNRTRFETVR